MTPPDHDPRTYLHRYTLALGAFISRIDADGYEPSITHLHTIAAPAPELSRHTPNVFIAHRFSISRRGLTLDDCPDLQRWAEHWSQLDPLALWLGEWSVSLCDWWAFVHHRPNPFRS